MITKALGFPEWWNRFVIDSVMTARALKVSSKTPQGDLVTCTEISLKQDGLADTDQVFSILSAPQEISSGYS
jgi:hypothetical protein